MAGTFRRPLSPWTPWPAGPGSKIAVDFLSAQDTYWTLAARHARAGRFAASERPASLPRVSRFSAESGQPPCRTNTRKSTRPSEWISPDRTSVCKALNGHHDLSAACRVCPAPSALARASTALALSTHHKCITYTAEKKSLPSALLYLSVCKAPLSTLKINLKKKPTPDH